MLTDFPIKVPYTTMPHMVRNSGPIFCPDVDPVIIGGKRHELARWGQDLWGQIDEPVTEELLRMACRLTGRTETLSIVDLALQFNEDIALIHRGSLYAICFCHPSSWVPRTRLGLHLSQIHAPVGDGSKLVEASGKIAETLAGSDSYRRWVWTIANSGDLSQHPDAKSPEIPIDINDLWFRTETQTTMPLGDGLSSLFFVQVQTQPLSELWQDVEFKSRVLASVNSMSEAILDYKNLRRIKKILNM